jgi:hypothetical protein
MTLASNGFVTRLLFGVHTLVEAVVSMVVGAVISPAISPGRRLHGNERDRYARFTAAMTPG